MPSILDQLPPGSRVIIVRLRSLGDCVLTTPAIHIFKISRPDLEIGVVVEPRFRAVFEGNPDIAAILEPAVSAVRRFRPALCINLHGGTRSLVLTAASGARFRAGFAHHTASSVYNIRIPRAQQILAEERTVHTVEHLASAMFYLGANEQAIPRARLFADGPGPIDSPHAVVHPFASAPDKTWPAERFVLIARALQDDGLQPVIIAGPGDDISPFAEFTVLANAPLREIKNLLSRAAVFIGNDSGPAHMAAGFGVPVVVLFGASDRSVWYPWKTPSRVLWSARGISGIDAAQVTDSFRELRLVAQ